jgi:hypothetical protein
VGQIDGMHGKLEVSVFICGLLSIHANDNKRNMYASRRPIRY